MKTVVTTSPSLSMGFAKLVLRLMRNDFKHNLPRWQKMVESRSHSLPTPMPERFRKHYEVGEQAVNGRPVYTISPRQGKPTGNILYTHGGGYVIPLSVFHWGIIQALVEKLGARVIVPAYPLAPEQPYQAAFDQLETVYRNLLITYADQPVLLCGDSAGGGLALAQVFRYRQLGLPLPQRIVLFSPWLDISMSNPAAAAVEAQDILLSIPFTLQCGEWWAGGDNPRDPLLSPIFGDLSALPPVDIFQGTHDLLIADARLLEEKITEAGGEVNLYEYGGAFHVFVGATFTPEAKHVYSQIANAMRNS